MTTTQELGSCPTVLQADEDHITATYAISPSVQLKNYVSVSVYACYSAASGYDRPWRKPNKANLAVRPCQPGLLFPVHCVLAS